LVNFGPFGKGTLYLLTVGTEGTQRLGSFVRVTWGIPVPFVDKGAGNYLVEFRRDYGFKREFPLRGDNYFPKGGGSKQGI